MTPVRKTSITAYEMLDYIVRVTGDRPALKGEDRELTFAQWQQAALKVASALAGRGVGRGDYVAVLTYNRIEQYVLLYATMMLGAVYVPINYRLAPGEILYILNQADARAVFADADELCERVDAVAGDSQLQLFVRIGEGTGRQAGRWEGYDGFVEGAATARPGFVPELDTPIYQMYTSGTTGFPKGVVVTQQQLACFIVSSFLIPPRVEYGKPHLIVAPLFHAAALCTSLVVLFIGRPVVVLRDFDPLQLVEVLAREKIAEVVLVPAMLQAVLQNVPDLEQYDFSHLEKIIYGASPITVDLLKRAMQVFKCNFQQGFGMTEIVAAATALTVDDHVRALAGKPELLRSCGRAMASVELRIVNPETRAPLPAGEIGEIAIRAPHIMLGYSKQPEKTAEVLDEEGWYYSGDGAYMDEEGYVYIKDRIKDMIVSGGENVYPAEVENALMHHPDLVDVAVIGVPDDQYGEAVVAVCVAGGERVPSGDELIAFCRDRIAGYKIPRRYEFVDQLPKNPSGKLLKRELRETYLPS